MKRRKPGEDRKFLVQTPKQYPWMLLDAVLTAVEPTIGEDDLYPFALGVVRNRSVEGLEVLADKWSPQCMGPLDLSVEEFDAKYQVGSLLKRYQFAGAKDARIQKALEGFMDAEAACATVNAQGTGLTDEVKRSMRDFIRKVLGEEVDVDSILVHARHGPGASLETSGGKVTAYYKFAETPYTVTEGARPYARYLITQDARWIGAVQDEYREVHGIPKHALIRESEMFSWLFETSVGNRITFVPKDARKDRPIAIEPRMNLYLQLGVDGFIRRRLKKFGCNLDSQLKNQRFAYLGTISKDARNFATLDLSMASDTVSLELCKELLPSEWFALLCDLRSETGTVDVDQAFSLKYAKMSSMGNGFTFALESLLFLAAARAAVGLSDHPWDLREDIAVYGDDIVVPGDCYEDCCSILQAMGFRVNPEKSFSTGEFRESCGCDYYKGTWVRPVHVTNGVGHIKELFAICNRLRFSSAIRTEGEGTPSLTHVAQSLAETWIPPQFSRFVGPPSQEEFDTYLHRPVSSSVPRKKGGMYEFRRIVTVPTRKKGKKFLFRKLMASLKGGPERAAWASAMDRERVLFSASDGAARALIWSMAYLHPESPEWVPPTMRKQVPAHLNKAGDVFAVTERSSVSVRVVLSRTSFWFDDYERFL